MNTNKIIEDYNKAKKDYENLVGSSFWQKYKKPLLIALGLVVVIGVIVVRNSFS